MTNFVLILIISVLICFSAGYIYKQKKKGKHCIGCPYSGKCDGCGK